MYQRDPSCTASPYTPLFRSRTDVCSGELQRGQAHTVAGARFLLALHQIAADHRRLGIDVPVARVNRIGVDDRSEEQTSELQSLRHLVWRLLLEQIDFNSMPS